MLPWPFSVIGICKKKLSFTTGSSGVRGIVFFAVSCFTPPFFKEIIGLDNIHAASKIDVAKEYIKNHNINLSETIFIGDTLHDVEVADAIGVNCFLVSCGHQSVNVLKQAKKTIIDDINVLRLYYDEIFNR